MRRYQQGLSNRRDLWTTLESATKDKYKLCMSDLIPLLQQQRQQHLEAIQAIDQLLAIEGCEGNPPVDPPAKSTRSKGGAVAARKAPSKTPMSRKEALRLVLEQAGKPLGLGEVVEGMKRVGFKFQSADPKNAIHQLLYGKNRADFVAKTTAGFSLKK